MLYLYIRFKIWARASPVLYGIYAELKVGTTPPKTYPWLCFYI